MAIFTRVVEDLNSGLPRTNPASGHVSRRDLNSRSGHPNCKSRALTARGGTLHLCKNETSYLFKKTSSQSKLYFCQLNRKSRGKYM